MRLVEATLAGLVALSICLAGPRAAFADGSSKEQSKLSSPRPGLAMLVQSVVDTVLERHIDPPARQQMILTGIKALYKAAGAPLPDRLSQRVSSLTTPLQLATLLAEIWPASTGKAVTASELEEALLNGLLHNVSGSPYLMPEKERKVQEQNEGNRYVGIHIALGMDETEKRPKINEIIEGGPADRAGVKSNDLIEQIDGTDTKGMSLRESVDRLRGDEGTTVTIKVRQVDTAAARTYKIMRGQHPRPTILGWRRAATGDWDFRMSDSDPIAYLRVNEMAGSTPHELRKIAAKLEGQGIKAIVFDLRGRLSNSTHTAVLLADSLLDHGTIGRVRTSHGETFYQADPDAIFRGWPIAVLVDSKTSGAAEWLAAAIQDNQRGIVIGSPTLSARVNPGYALVTSFVQVGKSEWFLSLATGILERGDGRPVSAFDRSIPTVIREPTNKSTGVHPNHQIAENEAAVQNSLGQFVVIPDKAGSAPDAAQRRALEELRRLLKKT
jgi:carboxyl-terminal processing protease